MQKQTPASSAIKLSAVLNQGQATCFLTAGITMTSGQFTQTVFTPSGSFENEMIKMISSLHSAYWKLASKSKIVVCLTDSQMLIRIH